MIIVRHILDDLSAQAKDDPRLRMNLDLMNSPTGWKANNEDVVVGSSGFESDLQTGKDGANDHY